MSKSKIEQNKELVLMADLISRGIPIRNNLDLMVFSYKENVDSELIDTTKLNNSFFIREETKAQIHEIHNDVNNLFLMKYPMKDVISLAVRKAVETKQVDFFDRLSNEIYQNTDNEINNEYKVQLMHAFKISSSFMMDGIPSNPMEKINLVEILTGKDNRYGVTSHILSGAVNMGQHVKPMNLISNKIIDIHAGLMTSKPNLEKLIENQKVKEWLNTIRDIIIFRNPVKMAEILSDSNKFNYNVIHYAKNFIAEESFDDFLFETKKKLSDKETFKSVHTLDNLVQLHEHIGYDEMFEDIVEMNLFNENYYSSANDAFKLAEKAIKIAEQYDGENYYPKFNDEINRQCAKSIVDYLSKNDYKDILAAHVLFINKHNPSEINGNMLKALISKSGYNASDDSGEIGGYYFPLKDLIKEINISDEILNYAIIKHPYNAIIIHEHQGLNDIQKQMMLNSDIIDLYSVYLLENPLFGISETRKAVNEMLNLFKDDKFFYKELLKAQPNLIKIAPINEEIMVDYGYDILIKQPNLFRELHNIELSKSKEIRPDNGSLDTIILMMAYDSDKFNNGLNNALVKKITNDKQFVLSTSVLDHIKIEDNLFKEILDRDLLASCDKGNYQGIFRPIELTEDQQEKAIEKNINNFKGIANPTKKTVEFIIENAPDKFVEFISYSQIDRISTKNNKDKDEIAALIINMVEKDWELGAKIAEKYDTALTSKIIDKIADMIGNEEIIIQQEDLDKYEDVKESLIAIFDGDIPMIKNESKLNTIENDHSISIENNNQSMKTMKLL